MCRIPLSHSPTSVKVERVQPGECKERGEFRGGNVMIFSDSSKQRTTETKMFSEKLPQRMTCITVSSPRRCRCLLLNPDFHCSAMYFVRFLLTFASSELFFPPVQRMRRGLFNELHYVFIVHEQVVHQFFWM